MTHSRKFASAAVAGLMGAAISVAAPGIAAADHSADPCMLGTSNTDTRSCAQNTVHMPALWTLGDGICVGMMTAMATSFDGPLWRYSEVPGAVHSVELSIQQGFSPLGEWAPTFLACGVTAVVDWHNLDTDQRGSVSRFVDGAQNSTTRTLMHAATGPGRVQLTMRTDRPSIPVSTEIFVP